MPGTEDETAMKRNIRRDKRNTAYTWVLAQYTIRPYVTTTWMPGQN